MADDLFSWLALACAVVSGSFTLYAYLQGRNDTRTKQIDERLHTLELGGSLRERRLEGFQQELERVADKGEQRCQSLENQFQSHANGFNTMREEHATVKAQVLFLVEGFNKLSGKIDRVDDKMDRIIELMAQRANRRS